MLATQNPIEQEGTYPLPEAQLDRFMLELRLGYPSRGEEEAIVAQTTGSRIAADSPVLDAAALRGDAAAGAPDSGVGVADRSRGHAGADDASRRARRAGADP